MASSEIKITSKFNSGGVDSAKNSLNKLEQTAKSATHNLSAGFENIKLGNLNTGIAQVSSGLSGLTASLPILGAIAGGFVAVGKAVSECVKEFAEAEVVEVKFKNSLNALGLSVFTRQFSDFAGELQKTTGISDEVIKDVMQLGLQMGISAGDIERITKLATNMSATFGIDLKTSVEMLAKAQEGQTTQLTRLLPNMKEAIKEGMSFNEVLGVLEERTNGASEAVGGTLQGSMNKLKQSFSDLKEEIGKSFAPALKELVDFFTKIITAMADVKKTSNELVEIQKSATYNYIYQKKQQEVFDRAIAEGWIGDSIKLGIELEKATQEAIKLTKRYNEYQAELEKKQVQEKQKKEETESPETGGQTQQSKTEQVNVVVETKPLTEFPLVINNYYKKIEQLTENMFSDIDDEVLKQMEILEEERKKREALLAEINNEINRREALGTFREEEQKKGGKKDLTLEGKETDKKQLENVLSSAFKINLTDPLSAIMSVLEQTKAFAMLGETIKPIIDMLDAVLMPVLQALAPVFTVLYQSIAPILKLLIPPLIFISALIANLVVGFQALLKTIWYVVSFQWNKIGTVQWTAMSMEQINSAVQTALAGVDIAASENPFSGSTTSTTTYSASGARDIYVNIFYEHSYVNGDAREIALNIRNEIRMAEALGL